MRAFLVLMLTLALPLLAGCKGECRQLSEKLCDCAANNIIKEQCLQRVSNEQSRLEPTEDDENRCAEIRKTCDCNLIDTEEGKVNCGLAWPKPTSTLQ